MTSAERHELRYQRRKAKRVAKKERREALYDDYDTVFTYNHLYTSYLQCCKGVRWKSSIQAFEVNAVYNVYVLYRQLKEGKFKSKGFRSFDKYDRGKLRHISSVDIWERVVQRCLCDYCLVPILTKLFVYDNSATQKGKGVLFCVDRVEKQFQEMYDKYGEDFYIAVFDYTKYFESIRHDVLISMLRKYIKDVRLFNLTSYFINCFDGDKGLGLGSQVSQVSALLYTNEIDHFILEDTDAEKFHRYMDDEYVMHRSKEYLQQLAGEMTERSDALGLKYNPKKTQFIKANKGFKFLRLWFHIKNSTARRKAHRDYFTRMRHKIRRFRIKYDNQEMALADVRQSVQSWRAYSVYIAKDPKAAKYTERYFNNIFYAERQEVM